MNIHNQTQNKSYEKYYNLFQDLYRYIKKDLSFDKDVKTYIISDKENYNNPLGKTAYYDPDSYSIVLYCDGRHIKDLLRSFAHELIHHNQNCHGEFDKELETFEGYAQKDPHLRKMEKEAYLLGNMSFRDWEDKYKQTQKLVTEWVQKKAKRILLEHGKK